ncbi:MAG: hypothetical protein SGJ27_15820 [Candidatus Melainabacteria bacterium]|nr:hypothetical protein [Candidatus Melainabacteria bacterium]
MSKRKLTVGALLIVLVAAFLSYFSKYVPDLTPTVDPRYETNAPELQTQPNPQFADKLIASNIAMVLIHSDFSDENAVALDSLRTWAKSRFSEDIKYLHPVSVQNDERQNTVFSAFLVNLFGPERGLMERGIKHFLGWRIDEFHNTEAYESFRVDYYELFGVDPEAATLLTRYQEERAKLATETITGFLFVMLATVSCAVYFFTSRQWISKARLTLSYAWFSGAALYLACGWYSNEVSFVVSAVVSALIGLYLRYPIRVSFDEAGYLDVRNIDLSTKLVAGLSWVSFTLVGIQMLTWVKTGSLINPDPITLLISSVTGNFLHEPTVIKRHILHAIGLAWLASTLSTMYVLKRGVAATPDLEAQLANLDQVNSR